MNYESYDNFLWHKTHSGSDSGFEPVYMPSSAFDFQGALLDWAVRKGRAAIWADCGLGKTIIGLSWATNVAIQARKPVLYLTPLAVASQTKREADKFGIDADVSRDGSIKSRVVVCNYEQLHQFKPGDFAGVVCDESSILKSFAGKRRGEITQFMRKVPYRLLQTATAAPNDFIELGTSSEALGYLGHMDMLAKFFKNDQNNCATGRMKGETMKWRLKGHAELPFWRWVSSWARAMRRPSDLGFCDDRFVLPPLIEREHVTVAQAPMFGQLFAKPAVGLKELREEIRSTVPERCDMAAELVRNSNQPALMWCNLNEEGDRLAKLIPDAVQVSGSDSDARKEDRLMAFADGRVRVLITKPKIGAWGLNYQHCAHVVTFPTHSFEQDYQCIRRCWRFGQTRPVVVDRIVSEGQSGMMRNLQRKAAQAEQMFDRLIAQMHNAMAVESTRGMKDMEVPSWA